MKRYKTALSGRFRGLLATIAFATLVGAAAIVVAQQPSEPPKPTDWLERWPYFQQVELPDEPEAGRIDLVLPRSVFSGAQLGLGDLRLYDSSGKEIPYALRWKPISESIRAELFNKVVGSGNSTEMTLDLENNTMRHNQIEIKMPGENFRRRVRLEGSDNGEQWGVLVEQKNLIRFQRGERTLEDCRLSYPQSRFRYLRLRISPDPAVDEQPVTINEVIVQRLVEVPKELFKFEAKLGKREPVRADRSPGSAWIIDLGGDNIPCQQIEVQIADADFNREYRVEVVGPPGSRRPFRRIGGARWQRRADEDPQPMVAQFDEVRASRLRLVVTDHGNPPLKVRSVKVGGAARQVIFDLPEQPDRDIFLAYGNPKALGPQYDFAANLPPKLEPAPARAELGPRKVNPDHVPEPKPFSERWPWVIYVVLGSISILLAAVIFSVAGQAIAAHDTAAE